MPLIYTLKYYVACMHLWNQFERHYSQSTQEQQTNINVESSIYKVTEEELRLI